MAAITRICSFNGTSLSTVPYLTIAAIDNYGPERTMNIFPLARRNARKLSSTFYQRRLVQVSIFITAPSRALADTSLDTLLSILQTTEAQLLVEQSGGVRSYTATFSQFSKNNTGIGKGNALPPQGGYLDITLEFECSDSYGYDQFFTPMLTLANRTSSPNQWNWTFGGNADQQVPYLQFYFTAGSLGLGTVSVGNLNTGQTVSVNRTWAIGDTLQINSQNNTVQVNGVDVNFTGAIPTFATGLGTITYSDTFTTRTFQFYSYVYNRWV